MTPDEAHVIRNNIFVALILLKDIKGQIVSVENRLKEIMEKIKGKGENP